MLRFLGFIYSRVSGDEPWRAGTGSGAIAPAANSRLRSTAMDTDIPLPFRLEIPDDDSLGLGGLRSVSYKVDGLLHVGDDTLTFEWVARRHTESIGFSGVKDEVDESPIGRAEVPLHEITQVRLRGWWWAPRLDLYSRHLDAFDRIPGAQGSVFTLRLRRHDRAQAAAAVRAIEMMLPALPPSSPRAPELESGGG
jgi:hypothetical protein